MSPTEPPWLHRTVDALIRYRTALFLVALGLFGLAVAGAYRFRLDPPAVIGRLQFDQSIEALYAPDDPYLRDYLHSKRLFGGDEFVIVAFRDPDLFTADHWELTPEAEQRIRDLTAALNQVPGVQPQSTQNLAESLAPRALHPAIAQIVRTRSRELRALAEGALLGDDYQTTAIVLRLLPEHRSPVSRGATIAEIRARAGRFAARHQLPEYEGLSVFVVGEPVQIHDLFRYVEEDGTTLFWWSLVLLAGVLIVLFRSPRWVLLPLLVVVVSIVWTQAILVVSGLRLSMVSSMLNSLVTIIGIATVTHVTVHFREMRRELGRVESLRQTLIDLLPAIFWSIATTAAGFASLLSSRIMPVYSFGLMMTLATLLVLLTAVMLLPGGILLGRFSADPRRTPAEGRLQAWLDRIADQIEHNPRMLGAALLGVVAFTACGFLFLEVETDFAENFREDSEIVRALDFVEARLGGAGNWEVNFPAPHELTGEYLDRVRRLTGRLRELEVDGHRPLTKVVSITDGLDMVPQSWLFVNFGLETRLGLLGLMQPEFTSSLYNAEAGRMRIVLRSRERQQAAGKLAAIAAVEQLAREEFPPAEFPGETPPQATGLFVLLAHLIDSLLRDQVTSFVLASLGIVAMMSAAFRSLRIGLMSLLPNVFPIVLVIGGMGWVHASGPFDLRVNIATAMIACVSLGLTVDSSIHYIAGYRRARARGLGVHEALRDTHRGVGRALVFANLALVVGFAVLTLSHFIPLVYFGLLVSVAMVGGLIGDLVLLPLLLPWAAGDTSRISADDDVVG